MRASSPFKDFDGIWAARIATYEARRAEAEARVKQAGEKLAVSSKASAPDTGELINAFLAAERDSAEIASRQKLLEELRQRMIKKPSFAVAEAWLEEKLDGVNTLNRQWDELAGPLRPIAAAGQPQPPEYFGKVEKVVLMRADASGRLAELRLLQENLSTLYAAKAERDQRRRRAWGAFGAGLARAGQQMQSQNWTVTCMAMGGGLTTCNGTR